MINKKAEYTKCAMYECLYGVGTDQLDLHLNYCGIQQCEPEHSFGPYVRRSYLIHVVKKGKGIYRIHEREYELKEGDAFLIPPDEETFYQADRQEPWEYFWIGFGGLKAYEMTQMCGFSRNKLVQQVSISCMNQMEQCVNQIMEYHTMIISNELRRNAAMMNFLSDMMDDVQKAQKGGEQYHYSGTVYVQQAIDYMTFHYSEKIKVNDVADYIGINRGYLTKNFKKLMGLSPQDFLINLRMEKAASLLKNTSLSVSEIAIKIGYDDPLTFSKVFKQKCGTSPKAYRSEKDEVKIITGMVEQHNDTNFL